MDGEIPCPGDPGEVSCADTDYCGQDAQYGWDVAHPASERFQITDGGLVEDQVTGLTWQRCAGGQTGASCEGEGTLLSWYEAEAYCEDLEWFEQANWTLPTSHQLHSIADFKVTGPILDATTFPNAPTNFPGNYDAWWIDCIWSSSLYVGGPDVAWAMMSNNGDIAEGSGIDYHLHDLAAENWDGCTVRCVQESAPAQWERFIHLTSDEPVVIDTVSQRFWQGCSAGQTTSGCSEDASLMSWAEALSYCEGLSWGGFDDWRLPNIKEMNTIVDHRFEYPAIDSPLFPNTPHWLLDTSEINMGQYWTSTAREYNSFALYVGFNTGSTHFYIQAEGRHARCVRGP
jgi:hypothetical protein